MRYTTGILVLLTALGAPVLADADTDDLAAEMAAAQLEFQEWMASTTTFLDGATFDEADVQSFIELWPEFDAIEDDAGEEEDDHIDYQKVLDDPRFQAFAESHGLDGETWFKKSLRILMVVMKEQVVTQLAAVQEELPEQLRMIEENKAQFDEATYRAMKDSIAVSVTMMEQQRKAWAEVPEATATERAALEAHRDDIEMLLMDDDDGWEEEEEWEDEDWEEE